MKIVSLTENGVGKVVAKAYVNNNSKHFNIIHGSKGFWEYRIGIFDNYAKPENEDDILELNKENYIIKPVMSRANDDFYKDARGNIVYNLTEGNDDINHDCLVLWTIPNKRYTDVTYLVKGQCDVIAVAEHGIERPNNVYRSPSPVVEIFGSSELIWTAKKANGDKVRQSVKYNYKSGEFIIGAVEEITQG